jgi:hypothetical protein
MRSRFALILVGSLALACAQEVTDQANNGHTHEPGDDHQAGAEILPAAVVEATDFAPEYIRHATGVEIIPDVYAGLESTSNTFTHEGNFGPLLFGETIRSFYIRLEPGMFLAEHPHPTESLVFTVSGRWVLCSEGKRQVMEAGSTFHFGSNSLNNWIKRWLTVASSTIINLKTIIRQSSLPANTTQTLTRFSSVAISNAYHQTV